MSPRPSHNSAKVTTLVFRKTQAAIAVCFVGQFLRHAEMTRNVQNVFAGTDGIAFDAYVSMSTQQTEFDSNELVNGSKMCNGLIGDNSFRSCHADLREYNGGYFINATQHLGFKPKDLYPHRTASSFSTISRCIELVKASGIGYDLIVVTRMDVIDKLQMFHEGGHKGFSSKLPKDVRKLQTKLELAKLRNFYLHRFEYDVIGFGSPGRVDDRIMIGPPNSMFSLSQLFATFLKNKSTQEDLIPEAEIYRFFASSGLIRIHERKVYAAVNHFRAHKEKYGDRFSERIQFALQKGES